MTSGTIDGVNLVGYLRTESGVGTAARRYLRALSRVGLPVSLHDVSALQTNRSRDDSVPLAGAGALHGVNLVCADVELHFTIVAHLGEAFFRDRYNIGLWAWELPRFPAKWFNRFAAYDEIWVGTSFIASALAPVAPIPVVRVPPVLTLEQPGSRARGRARLGVAPDEYVFLFVFDFHSHLARKNPQAVVQAFTAAFTPSDRARLVLKSVNADARPEDAARLREMARGATVDVHDGYWSAGDVRDLMAACDAYVSLHRSEGMGLTIADAMALGKPAIATGWSGNMDFMSVANSFPVRYRLVELAETVGPYAAGEVWAEPSIDDAAAQMRRVFDDRAAALAHAGRGRRDLDDAYSDDAVARLIRTRLDAIETRRRWPAFRAEVDEAFAAYRRLPDRLREVVDATVPAGATVLVVSKGDPALLDLGDRTAWHFPRLPDGRYAGFYPADSAAAIAHLEALRQDGAAFLVLPRSAFWWLEHYADFRRHLDARHTRVAADDACVVYALGGARALRDALAVLSRAESALGTAPPRLPERLRGAEPRQGDTPEDLEYVALLRRVRSGVRRAVPPGAPVAVVSGGDHALLELDERPVQHFPQDDLGRYAGCHPADSAAALAAVDAIQRRGVEYLVFPRTAFWWLDHCAELRRELDRRHHRVWADDACVVYRLARAAEPGAPRAAVPATAPSRP